MKRASICFILVLLLGLFCGCQAPEEDTVELPVLPQSLRDEMEEAWAQCRKGSGDLSPWADENQYNDGARYYGTYDGCSILYNNSGPQLAARTVISVGQEIFGHSAGFQIYAYKDGEFLYLPDAYEQGLISDEAISAAAKLHRFYERKYWEAINQKYRENYPDEPEPTLPYWATEPTE